MWRRVLLVLVGYSTVVVAGFSMPLALTVSSERLQRFTEGRTAAAQYFAAVAARPGTGVERDTRDGEIRAAAQRYHDLYGEGVLVVDRHGQPRGVSGVDPSSADVRAVVSAALRNQRSRTLGSLTPWSADSVLVAVPVGTGTQVEGAVVLRASTTAARHDIERDWILIAVGALLILAVGSVIAVALSSWTVRPVTLLALRVRALSDLVARGIPGGIAPVGPPTDPNVDKDLGPPEVRALSRAFGVMTSDVERAWESQRRLVADAAHALRNPLAALRIRLDTAGIGLSGRAGEANDGALAEVDRLTGLVDGLLSLAAAESKPKNDRGECRVDEVIASRYDAWRDAMADAGIDFRAGPDGSSAAASGGGPVIGMAERDLAQVLDVLCGNAVAYAGEGATVEIDREVRDSSVVVRVRDTGRGVPRGEAHRVADRFFRGSTATGPGSGLGLSIARALAERAGGSLTVGVRQPHGLRVELSVPAVQGSRALTGTRFLRDR